VNVVESKDVEVTGVQATGGVGQVTTQGTSVVTLTGVAGTGTIGSVTVWGKIVPNPGTVWTEIAA